MYETLIENHILPRAPSDWSDHSIYDLAALREEEQAERDH